MKGGDELVLDGLLEQTAPTRPLEAMLSGGFCEVPFLEPLPALPIALRRRAVGLSAGALEQIMPRVAIETAACFGTGALVGRGDSGRRPPGASDSQSNRGAD